MTIKNRIGIAGIALLILLIFIGLGIGIGIPRTNLLGALLPSELPLVFSGNLGDGRLQLANTSAPSLDRRNLLLADNLLDQTELKCKVQASMVVDQTLDLDALELNALQLHEKSL